jgi:hypothetical protein
MADAIQADEWTCEIEKDSWHDSSLVFQIKSRTFLEVKKNKNSI